MDFRESFNYHMQQYDPETRNQLENLAEHDAFLSLQGITRVLDILRPYRNDEDPSQGTLFDYDERAYGVNIYE